MLSKYLIKTKKNLFSVILLVYLVSHSALALGKVYEWRIASTWPSNFPLFSEAAISMAEHVKQLSNGRLIITLEGREKHKRPFGIFDMVQSGDYAMGHSVGFYWIDKDVNTAILCNIPFGMVAQERYPWFYHGGGDELTQRVYNQYGMMSFPAGNIGMQMGGWFKKEIKTVQDFRGLRIRMPGLGGTILKGMLADAINISATDLYPALQSGKLDAVEWTNPSLDLDMRFHEVAKYYYTGWQEPSVELQFLINKEKYDSLPEDLRYILKLAIRVASFEATTSIQHANINSLKKLQARHPDIKIRSFPPQVIRSLRRAAQNQMDFFYLTGTQLTKDIIKSLETYQSKARVWSRIGNQAYLNSAGFGLEPKKR